MKTIFNANRRQVGALYLAHEINAMQVGASAQPDNQKALKRMLGAVSGFFYLYADGRIVDSDNGTVKGYWQ